MFKYIIALLFVSQISFSQDVSKISTYQVGHDGMEYIVKSGSEMIIVSTYNSKLNIKAEIAQKIYEKFKKCTLCTGDIVTILGDDAKVIGKFEVQKKGKLTAINFYYQKIEWNNGLTEVYKKA